MSDSQKVSSGSNKEVRVKDAFKEDVGKGIVRIDPKVMKEFNLKIGDAIQITSLRTNKKTASALYPSKSEDNGTNIIRTEPSLRKNLGCSIDDIVEIKKIDVGFAEVVSFTGIEETFVLRNLQQLARKLENRVITRGEILSFYTYGRRVDLVVVDFVPKAEVVKIHLATRFQKSEQPRKEQQLRELKTERVTYEDIGGLEETIQRIREMIELPIRHPEIFQRIGVAPPKGVLLHGPPGTGKTLLARAVAFETEAQFLTISGPEITSKFYGQSEENLRKVFETAKEKAPSIIFIDEIDSIAPKRGETGEVERRVVAQLLALMDGLESRGELIVIGATNRVNSIDEALRRPGRFDREIEIGVPDVDGRYEILQIHTRGMPLDKDVNLLFLAEKAHGFVGADLQLLAKEAALLAIREVLPTLDLEKSIPPEVLTSLTIRMKHFITALVNIQPSALREVTVTRPKETWNDVGGLDEAKQQLREVIEWPLKYPKLYKRLESNPPSGILLYGPPGTGKTLIAKALAHESEVNFISVKGPEFLSKWVGESEKAVREIFRKARTTAPCIIFFDEIDAIAGLRGKQSGSQASENIVSQLLTEMDGLQGLKDVILLAATNRMDMLDPALLRSGRFGRHVEIGLPDLNSRTEIIKIQLKNKPIAKDVDINKLAENLDGYSGADIKAICEEAILLTIRRAVSDACLDPESDEVVNSVQIKKEEFDRATEKVIKSAKQAQKSYSERSKSSEDLYR